MPAVEVHRRLSELAGRQHGVIARRQLVALGFGRRAIEHLIATGRLHVVHRGVYLVGHLAAAPLALEMAAQLALGSGAALSHGTAGRLWQVIARAPGAIELSVEARTPTRRPGLRAHRTLSLPAVDVRVMEGLRLTAPARTLLDLSSRLDDRALRWAVEEARLRKLLTPAALRDVLVRHPGRRGAGRLRRVVDEIAGEPTVTRSDVERSLHDLIRGAALPRPRANTQLHGWSVDAHWPAHRLVAEVDGYAYHGSRTAFERDRRKDAELQAAGLRVVRLSWRQITREPLVVTALLARLLTAE